MRTRTATAAMCGIVGECPGAWSPTSDSLRFPCIEFPQKGGGLNEKRVRTVLFSNGTTAASNSRIYIGELWICTEATLDPMNTIRS